MPESNRIAGSTLLTSHDPRPPPHRVVPVTRVPRRSWRPARWPRATAYAKHPTPRHRLRAKSYLREQNKNRGWAACVGAQWGGVEAATAPSHPGPCPGSTTPSPGRHGSGATDDGSQRASPRCAASAARALHHTAGTPAAKHPTRTRRGRARGASPAGAPCCGAERCGVVGLPRYARSVRLAKV